MQHSLPPRTTTRPTPDQQVAADNEENDHVALMRDWRREWRDGLACALQLAVAIDRREWLVARANFYHLQILFAGPEGRM